jgi:hypothetical protein
MKMAYFEIAVKTSQLRQLLQKGNIMAKQENKLFTVAGTATNPDGTTKARFANDMVARVKILSKAGCTNINLVELPRAMTKLDALAHLQSIGITDGDAGYAVANKLAEKSKAARRGEVSVTLKTGTAAKAKAKAKVSTQVADRV